MKKSTINYIFSLLILTCLFVLELGNSSRIAEIYAQEDSRVLFISSYTENIESVPEQIQGLHEVLDPWGVHIDKEYMDSKRFPSEENIRNFYNLLKYKMQNLPPYDAIIIGDNLALDFALTYQEELFHQIPIIFLGIDDLQRAEEAAQNPYITGVIEKPSLKDNIDIALKFNPQAKKVVGIVEDSISGIGEREQFKNVRKYFPELEFSELNISHYTFAEMGEILQTIQEDTILLFLSMHTDKEGQYKDIKEGDPIYRCQH